MGENPYEPPKSLELGPAPPAELETSTLDDESGAAILGAAAGLIGGPLFAAVLAIAFGGSFLSLLLLVVSFVAGPIAGAFLATRRRSLGG